MTRSLSGQTILVTGGSRGIGAAIVDHLLAEGARVVATYNSAPGRLAQADPLAQAGGALSALACDLGEPGAGRALWRAVRDAAGPIDAVVHNAAIMPSTPLEADQCDEATWAAHWQQVMQVNVQAVADLSRAAINDWLAANGPEGGVRGRLVTLSSRAAARGDTTDAIHYGASKAALVSMMKSIARGYGPQGIRAFTVAPGWVRTDMAAKAFAPGNEHMLAEIPTGSPCEPEEIAHMVAFLLSGRVDNATGSTFDINGASYVR
ncbi:SDR family NAD(P)-dependent oxidoreductase [Yunchengibacter salinarum]|uniref:SDR family NAD(P)-dependent oxidoreductase n=1 Tax=Yunchengibacter salinarum TaxID=3133399 RepID=UPI0035B5CA67